MKSLKINATGPVILKYGLPNMGKPLNYHHLRSFIVGDAYRRILKKQNTYTISDICYNNIGENIGSLLYYVNTINFKVEFNTIEDIHSAYLFVKRLSNENTEHEQKITEEIVKLQNNFHYQQQTRTLIQNIFESYIKDFMQKLNVYVDRLTKESDYLDEAKLITDELLSQNLVQQNGLEITMTKIRNADFTPLMIRHRDGRYLFAGAFFLAINTIYKNLNPHRILYFISSKLSTQFLQIHTAIKSVYSEINFLHIMLGDILADLDDHTRNPDLLLDAITTSPCDLNFPDAEHKRRFMVDVFKLENYWKEPNKRVFVSPHKMYKTRGYKVLKDFAAWRQHYGDRIQPDYTSTAFTAALRDSTEQYSFVPLMNLLRAHMAALPNSGDDLTAINTVARIMAIFGLGAWDVNYDDLSADQTM